RHHADDESDQKQIPGNHFLGALKRVVMVEHQPLNTFDQTESNHSGKQWRGDPTGDDRPDFLPMYGAWAKPDDSKADNGADNGVSGRYGPAAPGSNNQPDACSNQRGHHAVDQELGCEVYGAAVD